MNTIQEVDASTTAANIRATRHQSALSPRTMQAIVQSCYGTAETLKYRKISRPATAAGEVLIKVRAAGVDRGVWHLMTGLPYLVRIAGFGVSRPKNPIPGLDVAGVVVAIGEGVSRFKPGDEVFGIGSGAYAEFAIADQNKLARKPKNVTFEQAAVAAVSGITALQALTNVGQLQPGQRVLVIGASGGVGTYAVQLARELGAHITGVGGPAMANTVRAIGADRYIDYKQEDFVDSKNQYDLIRGHRWPQFDIAAAQRTHGKRDTGDRWWRRWQPFNRWRWPSATGDDAVTLHLTTANKLYQF